MATNFLQATGGSTTGFIVSAVTLISSELVSLASSANVSSATVVTSSGTFGQSIWGEAWLYMGGAVTPLAGGYIACWWLRSGDGGTVYENTTANIPLPRPPDFVIPASTVAYASSGTLFASGIVKMPWPTAKLFVQNNLGVALASSATQYTSIKIGPVAVQY